MEVSPKRIKPHPGVIEVFIADERVFKVRKKPGKEAVLARLRQFRGKLPADFKFDRDDANARN